MELVITQESIRNQAKKLHASLKSRGVDLKLSDVLESLAASFGHRSLAALDGALKEAAARIVEGTGPLWNQDNNLFVVSWVFNEEGTDQHMVVYPPGTTIDQLAGCEWRKVAAVHASAVLVSGNISLDFDDAIVLENYTEVQDIREGLHDGAHESTVNDWVLEHFTMRVPKEGVRVHLTESINGTKDHFLVWVPDTLADSLRGLFGK